MTDEPRISVVIATHNRRGLLEQAVASVRQQQGVTWELFIVDDASTDDTAAYTATLPWARTLHLTDHAERSRARNLGLAEARGQYVLFLDDDDVLRPGALAGLCSALDRHPDAVAAVGAREDWVVAEGYRGRDIHPLREETRPMLDQLLYGWCPNPGQSLCRTRLVRDLGGFDVELSSCEDRDLWLRLVRRGLLVLCPQTVLTYRIGSGQRRPHDIRQRRERVARRAIRALPKRARRAALVLRRCTALVDAAEDDVAALRPWQAVRKLATATTLAPRLMLSPLVAVSVARRILGRAYRTYGKR